MVSQAADQEIERIAQALELLRRRLLAGSGGATAVRSLRRTVMRAVETRGCGRDLGCDWSVVCSDVCCG